jgi:hypothetical protein
MKKTATIDKAKTFKLLLSEVFPKAIQGKEQADPKLLTQWESDPEAGCCRAWAGYLSTAADREIQTNPNLDGFGENIELLGSGRFSPKVRAVREGLRLFWDTGDRSELSKAAAGLRLEVDTERQRADIAEFLPSDDKTVGDPKAKITKEEANIKAREILKNIPTEKRKKIPYRKYAKMIGCSKTTANELPALRAEKGDSDKAAKPKVVRLTHESEKIIGIGKKNEVLEQVIAEQKQDDREDQRQARIFRSK